MNHLFRPERWFLVLLIAFAFPVALPAQAPAPQLRSCEVHPPHLHANLWMQTSAEYQALCRQTFNAALREVRQAVKSAKRRQGRPVGPSKQPLAVVADLDETMLDNAKFRFRCKTPGFESGENPPGERFFSGWNFFCRLRRLGVHDSDCWTL
ncbi:MAG: hypothetical protein FJW26_12775, partial [Acidimicrobiia bacterium]|nr:hypothetical protein [Acidimicrobiia bacterium]